MIRRILPDTIAAAVVLTCASACATTVQPPPEPPPARRVQLDDAAIDVLARLLRMEDDRALDTALVARALADSLDEVRSRAALAAGRIRDPEAVPLLLRALGDSVVSVRASAAFALGELADSSLLVIEALAVVALADGSPAAVEAAAALGRIGSDQARPALDSILAIRSVPDARLHETLLVAWRLPRRPETMALFAHWSGHDDAETRWRAAYALQRGGGALAVPYLLPLVDDADDRVRANAVRGLRASFADSAGVRDRALAALLDAARDPHPHVRINAINLLPAYEEPQRTTPVLANALRDSDANVAVAAANALAQSADPIAAGALYAATRFDRPDGLRTAALHALARTDASAALAVAREWADTSRWVLRLHAARALARLLPESGPVLAELARDDHAVVAVEALGALRQGVDSLPQLRRVFIEQLAAPHTLVRAAAVRGLAQSAGPGDVEILLQAYDHARRDSTPEAAIAALRALARLRRSGMPVEHAFFLRFGAHGPPRDPAVYRLIADSIGKPPADWTEPRTTPEVKPPEFYDWIIRTYVAPVLAGAEPPRAIITTPHGEIVLELAAAHAPLTVHNFISLIERGYYEGTRWHRVVPNFVIQDGDPRGDGSGGPGYAIRDEINPLRYERGTLGMALSGPDTGGSQYFITHSPQPHLDGGYTVFGRVVAGIEVVDRVVQEEPILGMRVVR